MWTSTSGDFLPLDPSISIFNLSPASSMSLSKRVQNKREEEKSGVNLPTGNDSHIITTQVVFFIYKDVSWIEFFRDEKSSH